MDKMSLYNSIFSYFNIVLKGHFPIGLQMLMALKALLLWEQL